MLRVFVSFWKWNGSGPILIRLRNSFLTLRSLHVDVSDGKTHALLTGNVHATISWAAEWWRLYNMSMFCVLLQCSRAAIRSWSWWSTPAGESCTTTSRRGGGCQNRRQGASSDKSPPLSTTVTRYTHTHTRTLARTFLKFWDSALGNHM